VVLGKGRDSGIGNDQATHGDPQGGGEHQRYCCAHGDRTLGCARRHGAVGAASPTVDPIGQGLAFAGVSYRVANAAGAERCGIRQRRPLENGSEEQGDGDQTAMHGAQSLPYRYHKNVKLLIGHDHSAQTGR
jgi:hypothetical protein